MKYKKIKMFALIIMIVYTVIMIYLMFFWNRRTSNEYLYNLKPFKTIRESFRFYNMSNNTNFVFWHFTINIIGNIGMFIPFGILLPMLFNYKFIKPFITFEVGLLLFETAQLISRRGVFDIDDFILNTIGFLLGYIITKILKMIINKFKEAYIN